MTKAALCTSCGQVIGPRPAWKADRAWTWCACARAGVRWRDGNRGLLEVTSIYGSDGVAVIGLHNGFIAGLGVPKLNQDWRDLHDRVTDAPGYLFDKSKRECWAVLIRVGQSNDVFLIDYDEAREDPRPLE